MIALKDIIRAKKYEGPAIQYVGVKLGIDDNASGDLIGASLSNIQFVDSDFAANFSAGTFHNMAFTKCRFDRINMRKSSWHSCSFNKSTMVPDMTDAVFEECSFVGTRICGLNQGYGGRRTKFVRCVFQDCVFDRVQFLAGRMTDCDLGNLKLQRSDLRGTTNNGVPIQNIS